GCGGGEAAFSNVVRHKPHFAERHRAVKAEAVHDPRNRDLLPHNDVVERLPTADSQERVVTSDLNSATRARCDFEARLNPAVNPRGDIDWLDAAIPCEPMDLLYLLSDGLFDSYKVTRKIIDNLSIILSALPHR